MINVDHEKSHSERREKWEESEGTAHKKDKIKHPGRQDERSDHHRARGVRSQWLGDRRCCQFYKEEGNVKGSEALTLFTEVAFRFVKN